MLKRPLRRILHIMIGWGKSTGILEITDPEQKLSDLRMSICLQCEYAKDSKVLEFMYDEAEEVIIKACSKCNCPCHEKTLVTNEYCPLLKW